MTRRTYSPGTLKFLMIAIPMMLAIHFLFLDENGLLSGLDKASEPPREVVRSFTPAPAKPSPADWRFSDLPLPEAVTNDFAVPAQEKPAAAAPVKKSRAVLPEKKEKHKEPPVLKPHRNPRVVIIIDDMGMSGERNREVVALPGPLTLAYLPYAENLAEQTAAAREQGHELIIHVPMEAMNGDMDLGGLALRSGMGEADLKAELEKIFAAFDGYAGINNHMGSRLTQDEAAMAVVMEALKKRGLFFVDSKTISTSVAARTAKAHGVPYAERDVFLDHYEDIESVRAALRQAERQALRGGLSIAIGHPKPHTIQGLKEWLPTLKEKGIALVPAGAVVRRNFTEETAPPVSEYPEEIIGPHYSLNRAYRGTVPRAVSHWPGAAPVRLLE